MSLPASLMTDCGGLLNRRSPGRKRCCHTGLFTRDIMFTLHTDCRGGHGLFTRVFFLSRIIEFANWFIFTRRIAEGHGVLSRIIELSNFSSHGESRRVSGFMSRIIELSNFFSHGRSRRFSLSQDMFLVTNLRIVEFLSSRGMSRMVAEVMRVEL